MDNSGWIDKLDIPPCDFADPNFNPYVYDNADEWFAGRGTALPEDLQQLAKNPEFVQAAFLSTTTETVVIVENAVHDEPEPASSDTHTEESSQDDRSSEGVSNRTLRGEPANSIPINLVVPKPATFRFRSIMPQKPSVPGRTVPKPPTPFRAVPGNGVQAPVGHGGHSLRTVRDKPLTPPAPARQNMVHKSRGSPVPMPRASPVHLRRPHAAVASRKDEPDNSKRRSIAAARAGEYFIHSLRDYPEEAKRGPCWK